MPNSGRCSVGVPLSETVITVVAQLVDDAQTEKREPSHSDIEFCIKRAGVEAGDPKMQGQAVGKAKRVRATLYWVMDNSVEHGESFVASLISSIRGYGGFRPNSPNYAGVDCINNAMAAFRAEGYELTLDGELMPIVLENLSGVALTSALESYIRRARKGVMDAALITSTGKDLLEATAAHILQESYRTYSERANFPTLLGQAFVAVGLATSEHKLLPGEAPQRRMQRTLYELALAINQLRNKEGTGHGRPWLHSVSDAEARIAVELMGTIAEYLLDAYKRNR